jgi:hypothetical protein
MVSLSRLALSRLALSRLILCGRRAVDLGSESVSVPKQQPNLQSRLAIDTMQSLVTSSEQHMQPLVTEVWFLAS